MSNQKASFNLQDWQCTGQKACKEANNNMLFLKHFKIRNVECSLQEYILNKHHIVVHLCMPTCYNPTELLLNYYSIPLRPVLAFAWWVPSYFCPRILNIFTINSISNWFKTFVAIIRNFKVALPYMPYTKIWRVEVKKL